MSEWLVLELLQAIMGGLVGAFAMAMIGIVGRTLGEPGADLGQLLASKILKLYVPGITWVGTSLHFLIGITLAVLYRFLLHPFLPGGMWLRGSLFGLALWLILMVITLPTVSDGLFGMRTSRTLWAISLVQHLTFGAILAETLRL